MADVVLFKPKLTTLKVGDAVTTVATDSTFYSQVTDTVTDGITKWLKDVTVSGVEIPQELVNFLGKDSNGFQNQEWETNPASEITISGTLAISPVDTDLSPMALLHNVSGTSVGTTDYKRYRYDSPSDVAIAIQFTNSDDSAIIEMGLNNAVTQSVGDFSQDAESHLEAPFEIKCKLADFYHDVKG